MRPACLGKGHEFVPEPYAITVIDMPKSAHGMRDEVKVFGSDDRSLKLLGELLSNDTSRKIIRCLASPYLNVSRQCGNRGKRDLLN